jgi:dTDP-4-amino-4,6-dideoxygalactose transaminase
MQISFYKPYITEEEIAEIADSLRSGWITTGPKVQRFEEEFAAFVGVPAALALNSCTAALHVALATLGIGPGRFDEAQHKDAVITTPMTFCSSVHVIEHVGARPILVDIKPDTLNIDPEKIEEILKSEFRNPWPVQGRANFTGPHYAIRAILPVHLYGHPCEMDALTQIAREYNLAIIEDAAHALPARYKGRLIGSSPNPQSATPNPQLTCFSFYATKNLTTAEGGMLTGSPELIDEARIWSLHGMSHDAWKRYSSEGSWYY